MPAKSKKQLRYLNAAAARGDIEQSVADEFNKESKGKDLPESAPKKKSKSDLETWVKKKS
jgi:hypothetical protein